MWRDAFSVLTGALGTLCCTTACSTPSAPSLDAGIADAGWSQCGSPDGIRVCQGPAHCPTEYAPGKTCGCESARADGADASSVSFCFAPTNPVENLSFPATDGDILFDVFANERFFSARYNLGVLFAQNGGASRVRYADMGLWTGAPLPVGTCPILDGVTVCGGDCGGCPEGTICTGRSPRHPSGFCAPPIGHCDLTQPAYCPSGSGNACFTFTVEPEAQLLANRHGLCLPAQLCSDLSTKLPGGGACGAR
jgi:hypothetical protein